MIPGNQLFWSQKVKVTSHKNIVGVALCTLVSAGFFCVTTNVKAQSSKCQLQNSSFVHTACQNSQTHHSNMHLLAREFAACISDYVGTT